MTGSVTTEHTISVALASPPVDADLENSTTLVLTLASGDSKRISLPCDCADEDALRLTFDKAQGVVTIVVQVDIAVCVSEQCESVPSTPTIKSHQHLLLTSLPGRGQGYIAQVGIRPGETIIAEQSLTFFPEVDASDGMAILAQVIKQRGTQQLLQDVVGMAPLEADISDKLEREARSELQARGLESTPQVLRLYCVFKHNAFVGGIYPHIARLNHSCDPNCRFTYCEGRLDVWTCREVPAGQELTISYFVGDHFPGMPWDVTITRQAQLLESYDFHCACTFCTDGFEGLESVICGSCNGEIRPRAGVTNAQCAECDGTMEYGAVYSGALKLIAYLNGLEKRFAANSHPKIGLFNETVRLHDATSSLLHRHHVALFRMRALIIKVGVNHECDGDMHKGGMVYPCCAAWGTIEQPILAALNAMDATVVHLFGSADLMRNEILILIDQISHRQGIHDTEFRKLQWQIPSVAQVAESDQMIRFPYEQVVSDEHAKKFFAETVRHPAVITGAQVDWQMDKFDLDYLATHGVGQAGCVVKCITSGSGTKMVLADYIEYLHNDSSDVRNNLLYLFQKYPDMADPKAVDYFASAYQQPLPFQRDLYGDRGNKWLLIGPQGSGSALHTDFFHTSAWNALISGHKWWCFFPPDVPEATIEDKPGRRSTPITWFSERLPELLADKTGPQPIQALQRPGEIMWVPARWHHIVLNLDTTVAVTENFLAPCDATKAWEMLVDVAPNTNSEEVMQESLLWIEAQFPEHAASLRKAIAMACVNRLERQCE